MDNPKIIKIKGGTTISNAHHSFKLKLAQNFTVVSETETHFFFRYKENEDKRLRLFSIRKEEVVKIWFKDRTIKFHDLKKAEILNTLDNYKRLIFKARDMSKFISKYLIACDDMSSYSVDDLTIVHTVDLLILYYEKEVNGEKINRGCEIPLKYLWDKNWKRTLKKDYES